MHIIIILVVVVVVAAAVCMLFFVFIANSVLDIAQDWLLVVNDEFVVPIVESHVPKKF